MTATHAAVLCFVGHVACFALVDSTAKGSFIVQVIALLASVWDYGPPGMPNQR